MVSCGWVIAEKSVECFFSVGGATCIVQGFEIPSIAPGDCAGRGGDHVTSEL